LVEYSASAHVDELYFGGLRLVPRPLSLSRPQRPADCLTGQLDGVYAKRYPKKERRCGAPEGKLRAVDRRAVRNRKRHVVCCEPRVMVVCGRHLTCSLYIACSCLPAFGDLKQRLGNFEGTERWLEPTTGTRLVRTEDTLAELEGREGLGAFFL
jgi:hypothetical protein